MSTSPGGLPYLRIADQVRGRIAAADLAPGEQLPPISELARQFGTTTITARRALRLLEDEGLVRVEHGVGTFVAEWPQRFDPFPLASFSEEVGRRRLGADTLLLARGLAVTDAEAEAALGVSSGPLAALTRLRRVDQRPVAWQTSFLPAEQRSLVEAWTPECSLYEMLQARAGVVPALGEETVRLAPLPEEAAAALEAAPGSPAWRSTRLTRTAAGAALLFDRAWFPGDRVEMRITRRSRAATVEFTFRETTSKEPSP